MGLFQTEGTNVIEIETSSQTFMATTNIARATMKAAQVGTPDGDFESVERDIPDLGARQVRVEGEARGIYYPDVPVEDGL